jgi:hypothetical protein
MQRSWSEIDGRQTGVECGNQRLPYQLSTTDVPQAP